MTCYQFIFRRFFCAISTLLQMTLESIKRKKTYLRKRYSPDTAPKGETKKQRYIQKCSYVSHHIYSSLSLSVPLSLWSGSVFLSACLFGLMSSIR